MKSEDKGPSSLQHIHSVTSSREEPQLPQKSGLFNGWKVSAVEAWRTFVNAVLELFGYEPKYQDTNSASRVTPQAGGVTRETPKQEILQNRHIAPEASVRSVIAAEAPGTNENHEEAPVGSLQRKDSLHEPVVLEDDSEQPEQNISQQQDDAEEVGLPQGQEGSLPATSIASPQSSMIDTPVNEGVTTEHSQEVQESEPERPVENPSIISSSQNVEEALPIALQQEIEICELLADPPQETEVTTGVAVGGTQKMKYCAYLDGKIEAEGAGWPFGIEKKYDFQEFLYIARCGKAVIDAAVTSKEKTRLQRFFKGALEQVPESLGQAGIEKKYAEINMGASSPTVIPSDDKAKSRQKKKVKNVAKAIRKNHIARLINVQRNKVTAFEQALDDLAKGNPSVVNLWAYHYKNQEAKKKQAQE